jgi:hypothetical protein
VKDRRGFLQLPLALLMGIAVITGFSFWALLHQWKGLVDTQLRLDKCTGQIALNMKSDLGKLKSTNTTMLALRASIATAMSVPGAQETVPPLQASLHLVYASQEALRVKWDLKAIQWVMTGGCGVSQDKALPFSPLSWDRPPPDTLGENPIDLESLPDEFHFEAEHLPRRSAAVVERSDKDNDENENGNWKAHWATADEVVGL